MEVLAMFGTLPEAIKMSPIVHVLASYKLIKAKVCVIDQHCQMLDPVLSLFEIRTNYALNIKPQEQSFIDFTTSVPKGLDPVLAEFEPNDMVVDSDTAAKLSATSVACYQHAAIGHVETILYTGNIYRLQLEDNNGKLSGDLAKYDYAPTETFKQNQLIKKIACDSIRVTGNKVIGPLPNITQKLRSNAKLPNDLASHYQCVDNNKKTLLLTEVFGWDFERIFEALKHFVVAFPYLQIVYPVHLYPNVKKLVT